MKFTAQQIALLLQGTVEGNPEAFVSGVAKIEEGKPESLSFLANPKYTSFIYTTQSAIVIVNEDFIPEKEISATLIRVKDAYSAFAKLLEYYNKFKADKKGISSLAFITSNAKYGQDVYIGEFVFVGDNVRLGDGVKIYPQAYIGDDTVIGDGTIVYPGAKIYAGTVIGKECTIHAGAVVGSDGFGFAPQADNQYQKVPQTGKVILEDFVDIGANTTIDRATLGSTIIRKGVKLDNLIQIAHNVEIGENTVIAAQTGISGSTKVGRDCMFGGQVGLAGHLSIADGVKIAAQSGVGSSLRVKDQVYMGSPVMPLSEYKRMLVYMKRLEQIANKVKELEARIEGTSK